MGSTSSTIGGGAAPTQVKDGARLIHYGRRAAVAPPGVHVLADGNTYLPRETWPIQAAAEVVSAAHEAD